MSRQLLCPTCDKQLSKSASKYSELYESIGGVSKGNFRCDGCGEDIKENDPCFAAVLLPDKSHPNYPIQRPSFWMGAFLTPNN